MLAANLNRALITPRTVGTKAISCFLHGGTRDSGGLGHLGSLWPPEVTLKYPSALVLRARLLLLCV